MNDVVLLTSGKEILFSRKFTTIDLDGRRWLVGVQIAALLHRETYNLYRSLKLKKVPVKRATPEQLEFLLRSRIVRPGTRSVTFVGYHEAIPFIEKETKRLTRKRSSKCRVSMSEDMIAQGGDELMLERRASAPGSLLAGGKEEAEDPMEEDLEEGEEEADGPERRRAALSVLSELAACELQDAPARGAPSSADGSSHPFRLNNINIPTVLPPPQTAPFSVGGAFPTQQPQQPQPQGFPSPNPNQAEPNAHLRALMASPFFSAMTSLYILASMSDRELLCRPESSLTGVSTPAGSAAAAVTI
jgi:hypothetical protein